MSFRFLIHLHEGLLPYISISCSCSPPFLYSLIMVVYLTFAGLPFHIHFVIISLNFEITHAIVSMTEQGQIISGIIISVFATSILPFNVSFIKHQSSAKFCILSSLSVISFMSVPVYIPKVLIKFLVHFNPYGLWQYLDEAHCFTFVHVNLKATTSSKEFNCVEGCFK